MLPGGIYTDSAFATVRHDQLVHTDYANATKKDPADRVEQALENRLCCKVVGVLSLVFSSRLQPCTYQSSSRVCEV